MKRIILIICGFLILLEIYGQVNISMIQNENKWNVLRVDLLNPSNPSYTNLTYQIIGDTIIGDENYYKIYSRNENITGDWNYSGALREDENGKVWLYYEYSNDDKLLYDFTHTVGDTITYLILDMVVDSISYNEISGNIRKHIHFTYIQMPEFNEMWIEGIGSDKGVLFSGNGIALDSYNELLCMYENEVLTYMNPNYNTCYYTSNNIYLRNESIVEIFPNPAKKVLIFKNPNNLNIECISLFDLKGKKLKEFEIKKTEFNVSELSKGIYLIQLTHENGIIIKKIIIE